MPCSSSALGVIVMAASVTVIVVSTRGLRARGFFVAAGDLATFSAAGAFVFARDRFAGVLGVTSSRKYLLEKIQSVWKQAWLVPKRSQQYDSSPSGVARELSQLAPEDCTNKRFQLNVGN